MPDANKGPKIVLSIDGGGFRGLACLVMLGHLMRKLVNNPNEDPIPAPCQVFDLICGTSTGGLIAILLGRLGLDCRTAIAVYRELGAALFGKDEKKVLENTMAGEGFQTTMFEEMLASVVAKYTGDKDVLLKPLKERPDDVNHGSTDTFVTVVDAVVGAASVEPYRLRTYATPQGGVSSAPTDHKWTVCQGARAASASPMFLPPVVIGPHSFQDAASSGFSNPVREAVTEAELRWSKGTELVVISLGTGLVSLASPAYSSGDDLDEQDFRDLSNKLRKGVKTEANRCFDELAKQLVAVSIDTQRAHFDMRDMFEKMGREDNYFRFNPPQGLGDIDVSDYMQEAMIIPITNAWVGSPSGAESMRVASRWLKAARKRRNAAAAAAIQRDVSEESGSSEKTVLETGPVKAGLDKPEIKSQENLQSRGITGSPERGEPVQLETIEEGSDNNKSEVPGPWDASLPPTHSLQRGIPESTHSVAEKKGLAKIIQSLRRCCCSL